MAVLYIKGSKEVMDIEKIFTYHNPTDIDLNRFKEIRDAAKVLGNKIMEHGGFEEEKEKSIHKLRECVFYAIASIVLPEGSL